MKENKYYLPIAFLMAALVCLSCASVKDSGGTSAGTSAFSPELPPEAGLQTVLLPLSDGWYQCDSERTFKGIEDEYNFALSTGTNMVQEITYKYTGVVCRFEDGVLFDPVTGIELSIDGEGRISCAQNISIRGNLEKNGRFFWSGLKEEHGRLNSIFVKGSISPLPDSVRGGREFDGVYHMIDTGTGKELLVNISGGFYTWSFLDEEEAGFTPWPTLIKPDGSFLHSLEITTVMEMGDMSQNFSNSVFMEGKVIPGQGITMEESTRSSGLGIDHGGAPQAYAGTVIRSGEYPNEAIPADIESLIRTGRAAVRAEPKPSPAKYPSWYLNFPEKPGSIYAAGEKTFEVRETAFAMAEAAAAARIAEQLRVRIESSITERTTEKKTSVEEQSTSETLQRLNYRIIERVYNEETHTAFVLAEMAVD